MQSHLIKSRNFLKKTELVNYGKASLKGMVGGSGIDAANTAEDHVDIMKKAYELGKNL